MKAEPETRSQRVWEVTIESDWLTTLGAALLLILCGLLLSREIAHVMWGHFVGPMHLQRSFWSIFSKAFELIVAIYCFMFAFKFPRKSLKVASVLMGTNFAGYFVLSCFHISSSVRHIAAVSGSVMRQIALAIFCVAIAQWLKSVVRWDSPSETCGGDC